MCGSKAPDGWVDRWLHNWLGWFNTLSDAWSVVPSEDLAQYRMFAFRLAPVFYHQGQARPVEVPGDVHPEPLPPGTISLGYDVFSKSSDGILGFECSPLSCNSMAPEFAINRCCLLLTVEHAHAAAVQCSIEQPEPGDYYLAEVLEVPRTGRRTMQ